MRPPGLSRRQPVAWCFEQNVVFRRFLGCRVEFARFSAILLL